MGDMYNRGGGALNPTSVTTTIVTADDLEIDGTTLSIDATNNRVGVGTITPGVQLEVQDTTTSSANTGGALRLSANDGAVMGDSHRLGVIEFTGAEDASNTQTVGARIEALTDAAWTNAENGCALYFYTTDGNASQTNVLKLDSNKKATFAGVVDITDATDASDDSGDTGALRVEGGASIAKKLYVGTDLDVDGTANLDAVDIDGAVQVDNTVTVGVDNTGYDVKFFGATSGAYMLWDENVDDLILAGAARAVVPEGQLVLGSTAITSTAAELNLLDGVSGLVQADLTKLAAVDATAAEINAACDASARVAADVAVASDHILICDGGATGATKVEAVAHLMNAVAGTGLSESSGVLNVDAAQTGITSVGTIGTGTWQGTAIASAYLDAQTAHLDTVQTFTAAKTFTAAVTVGVNDAGHDVIFYGNAASANVTWDASEDDLIVNGAARVVVPDGQLVLASTAITSTAAELNKLDGYTGSVTELNYLDTLHATGVTDTEFDYLDGVTSAIQTQLDGKSPVAGHSSIATVGTIGTGTWQGTAIADAYLSANTAHLDTTQTFTGAKTFSADVVISGATPQLTIGDGGAEDTFLVFDGNAADFRIGIDDGTDTLEIGKGAAHETTAVIKIDSSTNCQIMHNSAVADGEFEGDLAVLQAGEDLTAGEVVYFKSDGKCWKAVATAAATSRCVAMATATISANAMGVFLLKGFVRFASEFPTFTIGAPVYTPEAETQNASSVDVNVPEVAAPDGDGDFVQVIGWALSADAMYFNPDSTVIEVA